MLRVDASCLKRESQESENPREHFNVDAKNVKEWAFVQPSIQCASLGFRTDETLTLALFACLDDLDSRAPSVSDSVYGKAWLSTGYLNLHDSFSSHLLSARDTPVHLLAAAPSANGFSPRGHCWFFANGLLSDGKEALQ